ncbi:MAG TPA: SPOR domain-containing protein [Thermoanaerobaculia bacterium]|nr:SPOR domain-containing protein [Thermoanaerobaculia bacterium]
MEEHAVADDQSHYEISLTAGQAFVAFVLLLLSLAAAFAFGLMIGKGQADDRLVVQKATPVVTEASLTPKKNEGRIVELGVEADDFQDDAAATETTASEATVTAAVVEEAPVVTETAGETPAGQPAGTPAVPPPAQQPQAQATPAQLHVTTYAQLLSTSDQKTAETLAVRLINRGFTAAYVERGSSDKGPVFRVRVKFDSDAAARAAEPKLMEFSKEVWITTK